MRRLLFSMFGKSNRSAKALFFCLVISFLLIVPKTVGATAPTVFEIIDSTTRSGSYGGTGGTSGVRIAQKYVPPSDQLICSVSHKVRQNPGNAGGVVLRIMQGGSNADLGVKVSTVHVVNVPSDFVGSYVRFDLPECITLSSGLVYWFLFEPKNYSTFGSTHSFYATENQYDYSIYWKYDGFTAVGGGGWKQDLAKEWSLKLEGPEPPPKKQPVIIVPGILGSKLNRVSDGEEVWPNAGNLFFQKADVFLNELISDREGEPKTLIAPTALFDSFSGKTIYGDLVKNFSSSGYASGTELFTVPYDWRLRIASSTSRLDETIKKAISESPTGKVTIIAHSMGGLLVKEYLRQSTSTEFIDKLILAGVPELGSPKAFKALTFGDNFGFGFWSMNIFNLERSKIIAQNMPGVYELLPSRKYFDVGRPYIYDATGETINLPDYEKSSDFMLRDPDDSRNGFLINSAGSFHSSLDDVGYNVSTSSIYRLAGCQNPKTIGGIRIYPDNEFNIDPTDGDGTVPLFSATNSPAGHEYYALYNKTRINHMGLVGDERTLSLIKNIVSGTTSTLADGITTNIADCGLISAIAPNETTMAFSTHSPVLLHLYDNQGRHTGPDANGDIELGIPDSSYDVIGDNSFAWAPGGVEYRVVIDATNSGSFDMKVKKMNGISTMSQTTYIKIPLASDQAMASISVSALGDSSALTLDNDGDEVSDSEIQPTAILDGEVSTDLIAPVIVFNNIENGARYLHSATLTPEISFSDSISGVATTSIELDGTLIESGVSIDLFNLSLGSHALVVTSRDKVGNVASALMNFEIFSSKESVISDIGRLKGLGGISEGFDEVLIGRVNELTLENRASFLSELKLDKGRCYITARAYELLKTNVEVIEF